MCKYAFSLRGTPLVLLFLFGCSYVLAWFTVVNPGLVHAQEADLPPMIEVVQEGADLHISWHVDVEQAADANELDSRLLDEWHWSELQGYMLPFASITIELADDAALVPRVAVEASTPWVRDLTLAEEPEMRAPDGEALPNLDPTTAQMLPTSPIFVAREGRRRGVRLAVITISPIFEQAGAPLLATVVEAVIPSAQLAGASLSPASPLAPRDNVQDAAVSPLSTPIEIARSTPTTNPTATPPPSSTATAAITVTLTATNTILATPTLTKTAAPVTPTSTAGPTHAAIATATPTVTQTMLPTTLPATLPTETPILSPTLPPNTAIPTVVEEILPLTPLAQNTAESPVNVDEAVIIDPDSAQGNQWQNIFLEIPTWGRNIGSRGLGTVFWAILFMGIVAILWRNIDEQ